MHKHVNYFHLFVCFFKLVIFKHNLTIVLNNYFLSSNLAIYSIWIYI